MTLRFSMDFPENFSDLYNKIHSNEKGRLMLEIEGISRDNLDFAKNSKKYFLTDNVADISIDSNANVDNGINHANYVSELSKPMLKLENYFLIYRMIEKEYGEEEANKIFKSIIYSDIYLHDPTNVQVPYCFSTTTSRIMIEGRPWSEPVAIPPKTAASFIGQVIETVMNLSSSQMAGAVAIGDLFVNYSYYAKKENLTDKQIENHFQSLVYIFNNKFSRGSQSPFTNLSLFCRNNLEALFNGYMFPDFTKPDFDYVMKIQKIYMKFFCKGDPTTNEPYRFPVLTSAFLHDKENEIELDEEFFDIVAEHNISKSIMNVYVSDSVGKIASCCFTNDQMVLTKSSNNGVKLSTIKEIVETRMIDRENFKVWQNGFWSKAKMVKILKQNREIFQVETVNNKILKMTEDHLNLTFDGEKLTKDLTENDYIAFNTNETKSIPEHSENLTYEQGVLIGAYLGDGSSEKNRINFSINKEKYEKLNKIIAKALEQWNLNVKMKLYKEYNNVYPCVISSKELHTIIKRWVKGSCCYEKSLNLDVILQSIEFRKGILDGMYITDGGNSNRIYTTSEQLSKDFEVLITSLGKNSIINISDRTDEKVMIRGEEFNRNHVLYCIRWYENRHKSKQKNIYKFKNNTIYFKIKNITNITNIYKDEYVYCFEMKDQTNPYFTLPTGINTHNCRLNSQTKLNGADSFGNGGLSVGSHRVVSINLPRVAIESEFQSDDQNRIERFYEILDDQLDMVHKTLKAHRKLLHKRADAGFLQFVKPLNYINIDKMLFSTIGILGMHEMMYHLTGNDMYDENGKLKENVIALEKNIINYINDKASEWSENENVNYNLEEVPGESLAPKFALKDKIIYGEEVQPFELYSNQFIPLTVDMDIFDRMKYEGIFFKALSGGGICHINVDSQIKSKEDMKKIMRYAIECGLQHFAVNYNFNKCENGHIHVGDNNLKVCAECGGEIIDNISRVVGFFVPRSQMNKIRRESEYFLRKFKAV